MTWAWILPGTASRHFPGALGDKQTPWAAFKGETLSCFLQSKDQLFLPPKVSQFLHEMLRNRVSFPKYLLEAFCPLFS